MVNEKEVAMKTKSGKLLFVVVPMLLAAGSLAAQETGASREADHTALRALMADVTQAVNNQDVDKMASCFTKDFVFTTVDQSILTNTASIKEYYDRMLRQKDSPVTNYEVVPKAAVLTVFLDANTGYCYGTSDDIYTLRRNGRKVPMTCRWTATVVKENGIWKMATAHAGVDVLNNPVLDSITLSMWRNILMAGGIGILVGIGVGIVAARRVKKTPG
jgi:uncharacterized protein (TIGR02246 family)